jgi:hypothetical protein
MVLFPFMNGNPPISKLEGPPIHPSWRPYAIDHTWARAVAPSWVNDGLQNGYSSGCS